MLHVVALQDKTVSFFSNYCNSVNLVAEEAVTKTQGGFIYCVSNRKIGIICIFPVSHQVTSSIRDSQLKSNS